MLNLITWKEFKKFQQKIIKIAEQNCAHVCPRVKKKVLTIFAHVFPRAKESAHKQ